MKTTGDNGVPALPGASGITNAHRKSVFVPVLVLVACVVAFACVIYFATRATDANYSRVELEKHQVKHLRRYLHWLVESPEMPEMVEQIPETRGSDLWWMLVQKKLTEDVGLGRFVSLNSETDEMIDRSRLNRPDQPENWVSYTAPRLAELEKVLAKKGADRVVVVTLNARNWHNFGDAGVVVLWSDPHEIGEFLTEEDAAARYGITPEEWADPAGKLFGKKAPFQFTYE